jgi:hypothetical protein
MPRSIEAASPPVDAFGRSRAHFRGALAFRRSAAALARTFNL